MMIDPKNKNIFLIGAIALVIIGLGVWFLTQNNQSGKGGNFSDWKTVTDKGVTFQYPEKLGTKYINTVDWPPLVQVVEAPFACGPVGQKSGQAGQTEEITVAGRRYCVTSVTGAAAGSVYTQYAYVFEKDTSLIIFAFSLQKPQCDNYDGYYGSEQRDCKEEQAKFDVNNLVEQIAKTVTK